LARSETGLSEARTGLSRGWRSETGLSERGSEQRLFIQPPVDLALHELCTLLCLAQAGLIALRDPTDLLSWQSTSLYEYQRHSLQPPSNPAWLTSDGPGSPAALALALAVELGWLRAIGRRLALASAPMQVWLGASRAEQRDQLLAAWSDSTRWNDLCRTPALSCEQTGSWSNDAAGTRHRLLPLLARLQPGAWYDLDALAAALQRHAPDFQRPDGNYDTWYIRQRGASAFLRGFEHWEQVEGALLRFVLSGPLHWLGATALATAHETGPPAAISLSAAGQAWLSGAPADRDAGPSAVDRTARFHGARPRRRSAAGSLSRRPFHHLARGDADGRPGQLHLSHIPDWPAPRRAAGRRHCPRAGLPASPRRAPARQRDRGAGAEGDGEGGTVIGDR
jgi:hypothetical protein